VFQILDFAFAPKTHFWLHTTNVPHWSFVAWIGPAVCFKSLTTRATLNPTFGKMVDEGEVETGLEAQANSDL